MFNKKRKRPSLEQRKVRSRDAARSRRSQETEVFYQLAHTLPFPRRVVSDLDKAAIMRVTLSFLRIHSLFHSGEVKVEPSAEEEEEAIDRFYPRALAGFIMVLTEEGDMVFLSESVNKYVGITQLELLGQSVYDFVHPCDQEELRDVLTPRPGLSKKKQADQRSERNFFLRMKSTLTNRGRVVNLKSAAWRVLRCSGHMRTYHAADKTGPPIGNFLILLCEPIPDPSGVEFPLDCSAFLSRHSTDLRFIDCDDRVTQLVGYQPEDLTGRSAYEFHHALDSDHMTKSLHILFSKGQVCTNQYRFLAKSGGYVWAETQATVTYNSKTSQPEAVVCLNFILSGVEHADVVFSMEQTPSLKKPKTEPEEKEEVGKGACAELLNLKELSEEVPQSSPTPGDVAVSKTESVEPKNLSFYRPPSPNTVPEFPQELCTPDLRQLLSPIFDRPEAASVVSKCSGEDQFMDKDSVEKFFTFKPVDTNQESTAEGTESMDLDMLAPYISMDDDFQLTFFTQLPESDLSSPESPVPGARKRALEDDVETSFRGILKDKRQRHTAVEEEVLLAPAKAWVCPEDAEPPDELEPVPHHNKLLTDRDPILGGVQELRDPPALMSTMLSPQHDQPDLKKSSVKTLT
ncbi:hypoxia inducible factor 1 subunit alpha, like isoform X1 [Scleropages formosus]|uniref:hypoxia inducible factor 1 subunit alpha, like isoform X1 n=2 Tax=Scleropages formosus TaxID=113540 RepID=UPI0008791A11|nr:hypoxia-inducible factor 3-alpha-like isoform X1 [Scleropages formosus]XP_018598327.1 hypoxia-inducible factor 3-alpha-like isoform X1 [Scleropages formosus]